MTARASSGADDFVRDWDVVVVGAGAGGLSAAVTAAHAGLRVLVVEKEPVFGGTTARSGGILWLPGSPVAKAAGVTDSLDEARTYIRNEAGAAADFGRIDAFLEAAPRMVEFFHQKTRLQLQALPAFPDYHPWAPGAAASGGRCHIAAPFSAHELGAEIARLRPPLREITFVGMMFNASQEVSHFFNVTRSARSAAYVARRLTEHAWEMLRYGRAMRLTSGNALVARLAASAFDVGVRIMTSTAARRLIIEEGGVRGVEIERGGLPVTIRASGGVVLAGGGFPQDPELKRRLFPHARRGQEHHSPAPPGNTGDGWRLAEASGARVVEDLPNAAAWIPVSRVLQRDGTVGVFPHLIDRYKPGIIAVTRAGRRFVNEADSYHDFCIALHRVSADDPDPAAWLICDHRALRRYGMGFVKPFPLPYSRHLRSGYLLRGRTPRELGTAAGIDPERLRETIDAFNASARHGEDPQFGKGNSPYNRYLGDAGASPNPCVAPLDRPPYYAIRVTTGDLGTFAGIATDGHARVLDRSGRPIAGLYAVGNDAASVMGGSYPGGGITLGPAMTFGFVAARHIANGPGSSESRSRNARGASPAASLRTEPG